MWDTEFSHFKKIRNQEPFILLDYILSELDIRRRNQILSKAEQFEQCFVTTADIDSTNNIYRNDPVASTGKDEKPKGTAAAGCSIIYNCPIVQSDVSTLTLLGGALSLFGFVVWRKRG